MLKGLRECLTTILVHLQSMFCSAKATIYSVHWKLAICSRLCTESVQFGWSVHTSNWLDDISCYNLSMTSSNGYFLKIGTISWPNMAVLPVSILKLFYPSVFIKCYFSRFCKTYLDLNITKKLVLNFLKTLLFVRSFWTLSFFKNSF